MIKIDRGSIDPIRAGSFGSLALGLIFTNEKSTFNLYNKSFVYNKENYLFLNLE